MAKSAIESLLVDQASKQMLVVLRDAIDVALNGGAKPRKRGRKRATKAVVAEGETTVKRPRGRPKKVEATESEPIAAL